VSDVAEAALAIPVEGASLAADLTLPAGARGIVLFAHGSGSSRKSPRNLYVASRLHTAGFGTLIFDLLTTREQRIDATSRALRFDIALLAERLIAATRALDARPSVPPWRGYFGASTGAAAALAAAASAPAGVNAIVSRGGRPDLAGEALDAVRAPTLLIVGGNDPDVLALNETALLRLHCTKSLTIVPGATHLFEEPGALDEVCDAATEWFDRHCPSSADARHPLGRHRRRS
jgi:putative phosphoribosyl transferase